jgi:hypothetical protein
MRGPQAWWLWPGWPRKGKRKGHGRPQDWKKARGVEAFAIRVECKMAEIAKAHAKRKGRVNPNDPKERASDGRPKERVDLDGLDDQAGDGRPERRSTKVPTKSGHGFSVETVDKDISSGDNFSLASGDKVASAGMDNKLNNKAAGAACSVLQEPQSNQGPRCYSSNYYLPIT